MRPDRDYRHSCRAGCDCPDSYDPIYTAKVRSIAGRVLKLMHRIGPDDFDRVWERHIGTSGYMKRTIANYHIVLGTDRWLRVHRINVDNIPGQLTVFSAWLNELSHEGLNYHMGADDELEALKQFLDSQLVLDDMANV